MSLLQIIINALIRIGDPIVFSVKKIYKIISKVLPKLVKKIKLPHPKLPTINFKLKIKTKWIVAIFFASLIFFAIQWVYIEIFKDLPDINQIYNPPKLSTKILDRNGNLLYKFYEDENRTWVPLEKIPKSLIDATIAIEDKNFYQHYGISIKGAINALIYNFKNQDKNGVRGGSTITQQLVKNVFFSREKSLKRKIKEAITTIKLELIFSKDEILERYFNQVPYGGEAYGVQEAALKYFGKNVWDLNTAESAFLAGLPAAPSSYSPFGSHPELGFLRQKHVVEEMISMKSLSREEGENLLKEKINIITNDKKIEAPHFVFYIKNLLEEKYGYANFERQGLTITTSLDLSVQKMAEKTVKEEIEKIKNLKISNGAVLVINPNSGDILAMVGSKDYYAEDIDGKYNVTVALRQPGSSIKPINYLLAFQNGMGLASTIDDSPITYKIPGQQPYSPKNYNGKYMGRVTLKTALASSLNIPSVKLLAQNGVNNMIDLAKSMGINTWEDKSRYGLSLALGGGEVKMTELAQAYSIFANSGQNVEINPILRIENYLGENVYQKVISSETLIKPEHAFFINEALSDNKARSPIFGSNSKLVIPGKTVAVKTGTTNNLKDNWCIGWTPSLLVATWVGNNDSKPMSYVASGISGATPIWNKIMQELLKIKEDEKWALPANVYKKFICGKEEYVTDDIKITEHCLTPTPTAAH
jgi:1A family penicillin-binding protein